MIMSVGLGRFMDGLDRTGQDMTGQDRDGRTDGPGTLKREKGWLVDMKWVVVS